MLRLTLRSARDGRFLCRVVDRGGFPFVLDFGDRGVIDDASRRLLHGFTMWRHGRLVTVPPQAPGMLPLLAEYYLSEGLLVFLEEPTWHGRDRSLEDRLPGPAPGDDPADEPELGPDDPTALGDDDDLTEERPQATELIDDADLPSVDAFLEDG